VRVLDNLSTGSLENLGDALSSVELVVGDVKSYGVVEKAVKGAGETYSKATSIKSYYCCSPSIYTHSSLPSASTSIPLPVV
jgi:hypothetical protein